MLQETRAAPERVRAMLAGDADAFAALAAELRRRNPAFLVTIARGSSDHAGGSPLAAAADHRLPQRAGPERSVAATKSVIATMTCAARLVATWCEDKDLL